MRSGQTVRPVGQADRQHYENNYGGAVKRLNAITAELAALDVTSAPNFVLNDLKREELIAANSMILHEVYFKSLGESGPLMVELAAAFERDFGSITRWRASLPKTKWHVKMPSASHKGSHPVRNHNT